MDADGSETPFEYHIRKVSGVVVIELLGALTSESGDFWSLKKSVKEKLTQGRRLFLMNLASVPTVNSTGIGLLLAIFATQYLRDGGSIEALSKLLGHSEVRTTEIYGAIEKRLIRADFARVQETKLATKLATAVP